MKKNSSTVPSSFKRNALLGSPEMGFLWASVGPSVDPRVWHSLAALPTEEIARACDQAWEWFIHSRGTAHPALQLHGNHETADVKGTRQLLRFPMKLRTNSIVRADEAVEAFIAVEAEVRSSAPEVARVEVELLAELQGIVAGWFAAFAPEDLPFGHGPGSVSEGRLAPADKYEAMGCDRLLRYVYGDNAYRPGRFFKRQSRVVVVPKTILKDRTICAEPATLMFYQKGVQRSLYSYISRHPYLGKRIPLRDQSRNGRLALLASASAWRWDGPWDEHTCSTIDLSSASDRLSWSVVQSLFRNTPLWRHLWATRSKDVLLPDGQVLSLAKFAPMGSALCFPVQSIVYAACCELAARSESRKFSTWSVFGDDIICHASMHDRVVDFLTRLGLVVNIHKSFSGTHPFRESCGVEAYDGVDVTPITFTGLSKDSEGILAALDKACELTSRWQEDSGDLKPLHSAAFLFQWVYENLPGHLKAYLDVGPDAYYKYPHQLFKGKTKHVKRYQRTFRPMITARVRDQMIPSDELRLFHTLLLHRQRTSLPWDQQCWVTRVTPVKGAWRSTTLLGYDSASQPIVPSSCVASEPYTERAQLGPLTVSWL